MPSFVKKILSLVCKILAWAVAIYLILGFLVIPFALTWLIRTQGVKYINHNIHVKTVVANPLSLSVAVNGLEIMDDQNKKVMVEFRKLFVNVSARALLKKIYRVESVVLDGLKVNATLLSDGKINLLSLLPATPQSNIASTETASNPTQQTSSAAQGPSTDSEMPHVVVDLVSLNNARISFADLTVNPSFQTVLEDIAVTITGFTTDPECLVTVKFDARLDQKGKISTQAQVKPLKQPMDLETLFTLDQYAMTVLSPYVGKYTGRELSSGKLDFKMNYRITNNQLTASHKLLIQHFEFGKKVDSKDALGLPFGLAIALLEDPQGKINISLPVKGDLSDPEFAYWPLVGQVVRNFFMKLITKPFAILASVVGGGDAGTDEMGYVRFVPGKAEVSAEDQEKLRLIVAGLKERPKLSLEINGSYDPELDWKAIKTEVFVKDFNALKKESTRVESWVYRELYERRFGVRALWQLTKKFQREGTNVDESPEVNAEIKRQLIEDAPPDQLALDVLAQSRAKMIYDYILSTGFDQKRLTIGNHKSTQSTMGLVPLEFTLTVYGENPAPQEGSNLDEAPQPQGSGVSADAMKADAK